MVSKSDEIPGFADGIKLALGIQPTPVDSVVVLGKSTNEAEALKAAADVNTSLFQSTNEHALRAQVIRLEGSNEFFVTLGGTATQQQASETETKAKDAAVKNLTGPAKQINDKAAKWLLNTSVHKTIRVFGSRIRF